MTNSEINNYIQELQELQEIPHGYYYNNGKKYYRWKFFKDDQKQENSEVDDDEPWVLDVTYELPDNPDNLPDNPDNLPGNPDNSPSNSGNYSFCVRYGEQSWKITDVKNFLVKNLNWIRVSGENYIKSEELYKQIYDTIGKHMAYACDTFIWNIDNDNILFKIFLNKYKNVTDKTVRVQYKTKTAKHIKEEFVSCTDLIKLLNKYKTKLITVSDCPILVQNSISTPMYIHMQDNSYYTDSRTELKKIADDNSVIFNKMPKNKKIHYQSCKELLFSKK